MNCDDTNEPAPRAGCGCPACYLTRESALDPRLLNLAKPRGLTISPAQGIVHRGVTGYLAGRIDHGALHLAIITGLVGLVDQMFERELLRPIPKMMSVDPAATTLEQLLRATRDRT